MAGPFKLKSGNKSPLGFKMMGSSPAKGLGKTILKGAGKVLGKLAWPIVAVEAAMNVGKLKEEQGIKKFVGSMIWDKDLFTQGNKRSLDALLNPPKISKYKPDEKTTSNPKKIDWKNTKSSL